jgi:GT2 family glycosyltransferase
MRISIIIPTKDRPYKIKRLLNQLYNNKFFFNEILIIDSSNADNKKKLTFIIKQANLNIKLINSRPSISLQRNKGLKSMKKNNTFFMLLDDDIVFKKNSFVEMKKFINKNEKLYIGYGFNLISKINYGFLESTKRKKFIEKLGIYNTNIGKIVPSGWQTKINNVKKNQEVEWLSTQAVIYANNNKKINFDNFFKGYSYLEDLDYSYRMSNFGKLIVVKKAMYYHNNNIERKSFSFGQKEFINRYHFIKKNKIYTKYFFLGAFIKTFLNLSKLQLLRVLGNISGLTKILKNNKF